MFDDVKYPCTPFEDNVDGLHPFCNDPVNSPTYNGVITEEQMEWFHNELKYVPHDRLIVMNMHIPIISFVDKEATKHQVDNAEELYAMLEGRKALALSGHTHTLEHFQTGEFFPEWDEALGWSNAVSADYHRSGVRFLVVWRLIRRWCSHVVSASGCAPRLHGA